LALKNLDKCCTIDVYQLIVGINIISGSFVLPNVAQKEFDGYQRTLAMTESICKLDIWINGCYCEWIIVKMVVSKHQFAMKKRQLRAAYSKNQFRGNVSLV
jgi:hypothetical protein